MYTPNDVRIDFVQRVNIPTGTTVRETWVTHEGTYVFETALPEGCTCWAVHYFVGNHEVSTSALIVGHKQNIREACLIHLTEQRDVTKAPVIFGRNAWN